MRPTGHALTIALKMELRVLIPFEVRAILRRIVRAIITRHVGPCGNVFHSEAMHVGCLRLFQSVGSLSGHGFILQWGDMPVIRKTTHRYGPTLRNRIPPTRLVVMFRNAGHMARCPGKW